MKPVFETSRMYLKEDPGLPLANIFGITSFRGGLRQDNSIIPNNSLLSGLARGDFA
jgi:hypothetical protein